MEEFASPTIIIVIAVVLSTIIFAITLTLWMKRIQRLEWQVTSLEQSLARFGQSSEIQQASLNAIDGRLQKLNALAPLVSDLSEKIQPSINGMSDTLANLNKHLFRQIESIIWLHKTLSLKVPPVWTRGWAASPDLLLYLHNEIMREQPDCVVELGSGISTIVIADALRKLGKGRLISIDHDPLYGAQTQEAIKRESLTDFAETRISPINADLKLERAALGKSLHETWVWYDPAVFSGIGSIDILFVDGPTGKLAPHVRYPAIPILIDRLARKGIVLLDDAARKQEKEIATEWARQFDMNLIEVKGFEKGLAKLTFKDL